MTQHQQTMATAVQAYLDRNMHLIPFGLGYDTDHIVRIGTSIMLNQLGIGPQGGSFVQAVLDNDLKGAIGRADHINIQCLPFYVTMMNYMAIPEPILRFMNGKKIDWKNLGFMAGINRTEMPGGLTSEEAEQWQQGYQEAQQEYEAY